MAKAQAKPKSLRKVHSNAETSKLNDLFESLRQGGVQKAQQRKSRLQAAPSRLRLATEQDVQATADNLAAVLNKF